MSLRNLILGTSVKKKIKESFYCNFDTTLVDQSGNFDLKSAAPPIELAYGYLGLRLNSNYSALYALKPGELPLFENRPFTIEMKICYWAYQTFRQEFILLMQGADSPNFWLWKNVFQGSGTVAGINAGSEYGGLVVGPGESNGIWKTYVIQRTPDNTLQLLINGVLVSSRANFTTVLKVTNFTLNYRSSPNTFEGWVRDLRIVDGEALY